MASQVYRTCGLSDNDFYGMREGEDISGKKVSIHRMLARVNEGEASLPRTEKTAPSFSAVRIQERARQLREHLVQACQQVMAEGPDAHLAELVGSDTGRVENLRAIWRIDAPPANDRNAAMSALIHVWQSVAIKRGMSLTVAALDQIEKDHSQDTALGILMASHNYGAAENIFDA